MSDLYPTKTRVALLRQVAAGNVLRDGRTGHDYISGGQRCTMRIRELAGAGWVKFGFLFPGTAGYTDSVIGHWYLTDAGRAVLDGAK